MSHLILASPSSGIGHHVNRIKTFSSTGPALFINNNIDILIIHGRHHSHGIHHLIGNVISSFSPYIDHFIIFFTLGYETFRILSAYLINLCFSFFNYILFCRRNYHSVYGYRQPAFGRIFITRILQLVRENHSSFRPQIPVYVIDKLAKRLFIHYFIYDTERYVRPLIHHLKKIVGITVKKNFTACTGFQQIKFIRVFAF